MSETGQGKSHQWIHPFWPWLFCMHLYEGPIADCGNCRCKIFGVCRITRVEHAQVHAQPLFTRVKQAQATLIHKHSNCTLSRRRTRLIHTYKFFEQCKHERKKIKRIYARETTDQSLTAVNVPCRKAHYGRAVFRQSAKPVASFSACHTMRNVVWDVVLYCLFSLIFLHLPLPSSWSWLCTGHKLEQKEI